VDRYFLLSPLLALSRCFDINGRTFVTLSRMVGAFAPYAARAAGGGGRGDRLSLR
jgi:hypothetical protein